MVAAQTVGQQFLATTARMETEELHRPHDLRAYVLQQRDALNRKFTEADVIRDKYLRLAAYKYVAASRPTDPESFLAQMRATYRRYDGLTPGQLRGVLNTMVFELRDAAYQYPLFPPPGILITEANDQEIADYRALVAAALQEEQHQKDLERDAELDAWVERQALMDEEDASNGD